MKLFMMENEQGSNFKHNLIIINQLSSSLVDVVNLLVCSIQSSVYFTYNFFFLLIFVILVNLEPSQLN